MAFQQPCNYKTKRGLIVFSETRVGICTNWKAMIRCAETKKRKQGKFFVSIWFFNGSGDFFQQTRGGHTSFGNKEVWPATKERGWRRHRPVNCASPLWCSHRPIWKEAVSFLWKSYMLHCKGTVKKKDKLMRLYGLQFFEQRLNE